jgi:hypothetical protein
VWARSEVEVHPTTILFDNEHRNDLRTAFGLFCACFVLKYCHFYIINGYQICLCILFYSDILFCFKSETILYRVYNLYILSLIVNHSLIVDYLSILFEGKTANPGLFWKTMGLNLLIHGKR